MASKARLTSVTPPIRRWPRIWDRRYRRTLKSASDRIKRSVHTLWSRWRLAQPYPIQASDESVGQYGERLAAIYLERSGYRILERSFRTRLGEIDLIAALGDRLIVFVEVKTWGNIWENAGGPSDAVDEEKQRKITQTALVYCKLHGLLDTSGRCDVIEVSFDTSTRRPVFRHFENAFEAVGSYQLHN